MIARLTAAALLATIPAMALAQDSAAADEAKPVTRIELSDRLEADYADLDADKDGKVDAAEINARLKKGAEADLELIKKERDAAFAKFDTDGNGAISRAEFDARAKLPTIKEPDAKPFLDRFDANKDGGISKDEFRAPTMTNFEKLDKNKDGTLSAAEQKATPPTTSKAPAKKPAVKETPPIGR
ncbi:MAG: EF-hand domain-containing protein [Sphingomicrobium sp.]